jgi:FtsP/CotA-like multicopper oxidase with cupredoxin domain
MAFCGVALAGVTSCSHPAQVEPVASAASAPAQSDDLPNAPEIAARHGVARVELSVAIDPHTQMPRFFYRGMLGGAPTLRVHRGDRIEIAFTNALPANDRMGNATNLHFHGLVVAPRAPGDDTLTTLAYPGQTLHYTVDIGADQQPGLYWYHPHAHGNTFRQVGLGGMSGAIVVEGLEHDDPALASMRERLLVVRDVFDSLDSNTLREHPELAPHENENGAPNQPCRRTAGTHITLNDAVDPPIAFAPHETQFFRVLNATASRFLDLSLGRAHLRLIALDGVALDAYPGARTNVPFTHLVVAPGARAEFTVTDAQPGERLETACYDAGPAGDADPAEVLATIVPSAADAAHPVAGAAIARERNPLARALPPPVLDRVVRFTETAHNGAVAFAINGTSYDPDAPPLFTAKVGTVERWTIVNESLEVHAFHIHQVHFVPLSLNGRPVPRYWLDTLTIPPAAQRPGGGAAVPSRSVVLVDFRDPIIRGTFVFHCHLLDHEDGGMMAKIIVQ